MISSTRLSKQEDLNAYRIVYIPSISYPLGAIYFTPEKCQFLQTQAFKTYLPKIGFNRNFYNKSSMDLQNTVNGAKNKSTVLWQ